MCGEVRSALELEPCTDANRPRGRKNSEISSTPDLQSPKKLRSSLTEDDFLPRLEAREGTALRLTVFPTQYFPTGSTPSEITYHSLDSSYLLEQVISRYKELV